LAWPQAEERSLSDILRERSELSALSESFSQWCCRLHRIQTLAVTCTFPSSGSLLTAGCGSWSRAANPPSLLQNTKQTACNWPYVMQSDKKFGFYMWVTNIKKQRQSSETNSASAGQDGPGFCGNRDLSVAFTRTRPSFAYILNQSI